MKLEFNSLQELYDRIKPALITKQSEMKRNGYNYIWLEDIWNFFKEVKWTKASNLDLWDMVADVLNTSDVMIDNYLRQKFNLINRKVYFEEEW